MIGLYNNTLKCLFTLDRVIAPARRKLIKDNFSSSQMSFKY